MAKPWSSIFSADRLPCAQVDCGTLVDHAPPSRVPPPTCLRVHRPTSRRSGDGAAHLVKGLYRPSLTAPHRAPVAPCRRGRVPHRQDRRLPRLAARALGSTGVSQGRHTLFNTPCSIRRYKTDHVHSNLHVHTHNNASPDPRIWKEGPLTFDPQAWHRFQICSRTPFPEAQDFAV